MRRGSCESYLVAAWWLDTLIPGLAVECVDCVLAYGRARRSVTPICGVAPSKLKVLAGWSSKRWQGISIQDTSIQWWH